METYKASEGCKGITSSRVSVSDTYLQYNTVSRVQNDGSQTLHYVTGADLAPPISVQCLCCWQIWVDVAVPGGSVVRKVLNHQLWPWDGRWVPIVDFLSTVLCDMYNCLSPQDSHLVLHW